MFQLIVTSGVGAVLWRGAFELVGVLPQGWTPTSDPDAAIVFVVRSFCGTPLQPSLVEGGTKRERDPERPTPQACPFHR